MYNQLRSNKTLTLTTYNWRRCFRCDLLEEGQSGKERQSTGGFYYHHFTANEAAAALRECGFQNIFVTGLVNCTLSGPTLA